MVAKGETRNLPLHRGGAVVLLVDWGPGEMWPVLFPYSQQITRP
jgi:hypothetical protein